MLSPVSGSFTLAARGVGGLCRCEPVDALESKFSTWDPKLLSLRVHNILSLARAISSPQAQPVPAAELQAIRPALAPNSAGMNLRQRMWVGWGGWGWVGGDVVGGDVVGVVGWAGRGWVGCG